MKNIKQTDKNIKLHIITDIKVSKKNLGWQAHVAEYLTDRVIP